MEPNVYRHLPLPLVHRGAPRPPGGGPRPQQTLENNENRGAHSESLVDIGQRISEAHQRRLQERIAREDHPLPAGMPLILQTETNFDLDKLRTCFDFEVVAESDGGYVLVAAEDIDLRLFIQKARGFATEEYGTAAVAQVYGLVEDDENRSARLRRLLSDQLHEKWTEFNDDAIVLVDLSIACTGTTPVPNKPAMRRDEDPENFDDRMQRYVRRRTEWYQTFDELMLKREGELEDLVNSYGGAVLQQTHPQEFPDSFTMRVEVVFRGLRDIIFNHPHLFEVSEVDEIEQLSSESETDTADELPRTQPPDENAPTIAVVDSGIQETHPLIREAVLANLSISFVPGDVSVGDQVIPNGHGTRVAGAALYREGVHPGDYKLPFHITNIRVLDNHGNLNQRLVPQDYVRRVVTHAKQCPKKIKIFNHSISAKNGFRKTHMSVWATSIDQVSYSNDMLFIQAAGNLAINDPNRPSRSINSLLAAGQAYPNYLLQDGCRIANPAQSLQALTVGSISSEAWNEGDKSSLGEDFHPSGFSSTGPGIWNTVKPEVVELGGCLAIDTGNPPQASPHANSSLETVRATNTRPGRLTSKDAFGTSFSTPRVAGLAAAIQELLPDEPALLYRALLVNAARWPEWAENSPDPEKVIRMMGFGIPNDKLALESSDHRVTLVTHGLTEIGGAEAHLYRIPIPEDIRRPGEESLIRLDITLSYAAKPRRSRRNPRGYLSTWLDWKSCNKYESYASFAARIMAELEGNTPNDGGDQIGWMLRERPDYGQITGVRRSAGTVQKDWAVLHSYELPEDLCIAVKGHKGWDKNSEDKAKYTLAVTLESLGNNVELYASVETEIRGLVEVPGITLDI